MLETITPAQRKLNVLRLAGTVREAEENLLETTKIVAELEKMRVFGRVMLRVRGFRHDEQLRFFRRQQNQLELVVDAQARLMNSARISVRA